MKKNHFVPLFLHKYPQKPGFIIAKPTFSDAPHITKKPNPKVEPNNVYWVLQLFQNFCSSITTPSASTARQWVMLRASFEMLTPHFVTRRPPAS